MATKTSIDGIEAAIHGELELYSTDVMNGIKRATDKAMSDLVKQTKGTAPVGKRSRHYKDSITSKITRNGSYAYEKTWYVRGSDYRLSHLLNNGHALRDGGRYAGTKFITKASVSIINDYIIRVEEVLRNG